MNLGELLKVIQDEIEFRGPDCETRVCIGPNVPLYSLLGSPTLEYNQKTKQEYLIFDMILEEEDA